MFKSMPVDAAFLLCVQVLFFVVILFLLIYDLTRMNQKKKKKKSKLFHVFGIIIVDNKVLLSLCVRDEI